MVYRRYEEPDRAWVWLTVLLGAALMATVIIGTIANGPFNVASYETVTPPITQPSP